MAQPVAGAKLMRSGSSKKRLVNAQALGVGNASINRTSTGSINSGRGCNAEAFRGSFDNQAINELRNFI